jgi:hypothetical protein
MFGALMVVDMLIFGFMAYHYTYVDNDGGVSGDKDSDGDHGKDMDAGKDAAHKQDLEMVERTDEKKC